MVIVKKDPDLTKETVIAHCKSNLTGYKLPRHVEFRDALPKTRSGRCSARAARPAENLTERASRRQHINRRYASTVNALPDRPDQEIGERGDQDDAVRFQPKPALIICGMCTDRCRTRSRWRVPTGIMNAQLAAIVAAQQQCRRHASTGERARIGSIVATCRVRREST